MCLGRGRCTAALTQSKLCFSGHGLALLYKNGCNTHALRRGSLFLKGGNSTDEKYEKAVFMLREKREQTGRLPVRSDFEPDEACFIKQKLGPWPRALEAAGLKEPPEISSKEKSRLKRKRAEKRRKQAKRLEKQAGGTND